MRLPLYLVDAFAARPFEGNPAAVVPLTRWLPDALLQAMAAEHNLSETAFFVRRGGTLWCELRGDRVRMGGTAVLYARGEVLLPEA